MLHLDTTLGIVIVNYRTAKLCLDAVLSLADAVRSHRAAHILVLDGGSGDDSVTVLEQGLRLHSLGDVVTLIALPENKGFACANNVGIRTLLKQPNCEFIWLVNPDVVAYPGALEHLLGWMTTHPSVGIAGSRLEDPDGSTQLAARRFPNSLNEFDSTARLGPLSRLLTPWCIVYPETDQPHECDWLPGASLLVRRAVFDRIGLLDEGFFMYYEEVDFCKRAKDAGFRVDYVPESRLIHLVGQSSGVTSSGQGPRPRRRPAYWFYSRCRYFSRHHGAIGLMTANIVHVAGMVLHRCVAVMRNKPNTDPPCLLRDFIWHSFHGRWLLHRPDRPTER